MGKFKDIIEGKRDLDKERLDEAVGGVVSTPAINSGSGVANGRKGSATRSGDSRIDTGGEFTYNAGELEGFSGNTRSKPNPKESFAETSTEENSVILHEDDGGSVMIRETSGGREVVVRAGSQEKAFELDEESAKRVVDFLK